ncbi:hypothetical protein HDU91_006933 [Kappamyces sp. JEL0680]|nr:hypothetical protein HDU91_006933 [Kappamyces sp. JEL0680]
MKFKDLLLAIDTTSDQEIESFAAQHTWTETDPKQTEKMATEFHSLYNGKRRLRNLELLLPALEPTRVVNDYFADFLSILLNPQENLEVLDCATRIVIACLTAFIPEPFNHLQENIKQCAKRFLDCYILETLKRWDTFEDSAPGSRTFSDQLALDPSRIPRIEYVLFSFGIARPLLFYELLNEAAWKSETRLHSFMLLKSFLIVETDTEVSLFLTSITILTILLPIVATKASFHLDGLLSILINLIEWELSYPAIVARLSSSPGAAEVAGQRTDKLLEAYSINAVRTCIGQYFTVLYGMFPCNVLDVLSRYRESKEISAVRPIPNFEKAPDPFAAYRGSVETEKVLARCQELLACHRCHFQVINSNPAMERTNPWFLTKEASEIMTTCFSLIASEAKDTTGTLSPIEKIEDIATYILDINRFLYGPSIDALLVRIVERSSQPSSKELPVPFHDRIILLKIFYIILMNEGFFKECMRQYHVFHIRQLRKNEIKQQVAAAGEENTELRLRSLGEELKKMQLANAKLQNECAALSQRLTDSEKSCERQVAQLSFQLVEKAQLCEMAQVEAASAAQKLQESSQVLGAKTQQMIEMQIKIDECRGELDRMHTLADASLRRPSLPAVKLELDRGRDENFELALVNQSLLKQLETARAESSKLAEQLSMQDVILKENKALKATLETKSKQLEEASAIYTEQIAAQAQKYQTSKRLIGLLQAKLAVTT